MGSNSMTLSSDAVLLIEPLSVVGAFRIRPVQRKDERGFFARTFSEKAFADAGLTTNFVERSTSFSARRSTLRGLHFQAAPHSETKTVRCTRGKVFDVLVDLRKDSPSFGRWHGEELDPDTCTTLYIPTGCAHGYQTLLDSSEIYYEITPSYVAGASRGVSYDDPDLAVRWPLDNPLISERDLGLPRLREI
jgi:dTDP-4-dehydrorhamnose 3,5-epimerase